MPKIYIATTENLYPLGHPNDGPDVGRGAESKVFASGSLTTIKERLKAFSGSEWTVNVVQIKADVPAICGLIEGPSWSSVAPFATEKFKVNESGQVRSVK